MSPEILMGDITSTEVEGALQQKTEVKKPKIRNFGYWSAFEIEEWKKKIGEAFDQMTKSKMSPQTQPKINGEARMERLEADLEKAIRVDESEVKSGREPLGFVPPVNPVQKTEPSKA